jgi:hypothetical protein
MHLSGASVTTIDVRAAATQSELDHAAVDRFLRLAVQGLVPMFDQHKQLFCSKLKKTEQGMVQEGLSHRYTMMTLMGLHRFEQSGMDSPFDLDAILKPLLSDLSWIDNLGDLGVLLWLCGTVCPERFALLESRLQLDTALSRFRGGKQGATMELAWYLTGLSYCALAHPQNRKRLEPVAFETYRRLTQNQGGRGFFGHQSTFSSLVGMVRGRIGSFADQVYPLYGMAQFSKAFQHEESAIRALKCATGICEEQGPNGQWWWHYDSVGGRVVDGYPVFSVHQHAMGPMTLFGLGKVVNQNFGKWIYKGLRWIKSNNELRYDMESASAGVIWRCIFRSHRSGSRYVKAAFGRYSDTVQHENAGDLSILYECRPYELGWLLYAFPGRDRQNWNPAAFASRTQPAGKN